MKNLFNNFYIYLSFFINLFILVNPIGMISIFENLTKEQSNLEKYKTNILTNITVFVILLISVFFGDIILHTFNISISSFKIAGGILIIGIALSMLNETLLVSFKKKNNSKNVAIIPLAIPLIAGPGVISSTIIWNEHYPNFLNHLGCLITILIFNILCFLLFSMTSCIKLIIGKNILKIITKIMGLLLMSIGIEFITSGIKEIIFNI
ncbi:YchE family NAAT transporter [Buchnera aphidicola]|uniref:YchE family NAAT transporter n=1 Tax=Buchnera aphidicola TaxID=9 RepID=UPI0031B7EBE1